MELSLQSNKDFRGMKRIRQRMIANEGLHISDNIDYSTFLNLYSKYGKGIDEKDFAKYVLDIPATKHYPLKSGKVKNTPILLREYVSPKEIQKMREEVRVYVSELGLTSIGYDLIEVLHKKYGGRLELKMFAEETLGITAHSVESIKSRGYGEAILFTNSFVDPAEIRKRQNEIIIREKLHIDDTITLEEFQNLYKKYGQNISEKDFANRVLQMPQSRYIRLKSGKNEYTTILSNYLYNIESVCKLREKVIQAENLHIDDSIDYARFQELHRKYGGPLSEELFAEEVLDITAVGVKNMRVAGSNSLILVNIDIPEEYVLYQRNMVATENQLKQNQQISMQEIDELYKKYGGVLSKRQFATMVLDINHLAYNSLSVGAMRTTAILKQHDKNRFTALRRRIIFENNLQNALTIDYRTFRRVYERYGKNENETVFAEKIFDIPQRGFYNLKYGTSKKVQILSKEPVPTEEELEILKHSIASEYKFHIKDKINYNTFLKIYNRYNRRLSEEDFANKIFDISKGSFSKIKNDPDYQTEILLYTQMPEEKIRTLRRKVILENDIYPERPISLSFFKKLYEGYDHILSDVGFAEQILGINRQNINKLKNHSLKTVKALLEVKAQYKNRKNHFTDEEISLLKEGLIQGLSEEAIATRLFVTMNFLKKNLDILYRYERLSAAEIEAERVKRRIDTFSIKTTTGKKIQKDETKKQEKRKKDADQLRKKKNKIIADFDLTEEDLIVIRDYIKNCEERFQNGEFSQIELVELEECMDVVIAKADDIRLFSKICIGFGLYKKASVFISNNIDNEGIDDKDREKLKTLQDSIKYANKRKKVVDMITSGQTDTRVIAKETGILEVDIAEMQKRLGKGEVVEIDSLIYKSLEEI